MSDAVRVAVFVSGGGTNLQALIDAQKSGIVRSGKIVLAVSSSKDAFALKRAEAAGIKTAAFEKRDMSADEFEKAILTVVEENKIDVIVLAGFMSILSASFIKRFENRVINVHPSLIPSFCGKGFYGLRVHRAALEYGVKVTGATVHFVNEIPDGGKIIMQKAVDILDGDTPETLQRRVMENAEWIILPLSLEKVCMEIKEKKTNGAV